MGYQQIVTEVEEILSNILPGVDGLRGYKVVDISEIDGRILVHGEGPMFADVDLNAAREKCEVLMDDAFRDEDSEFVEFFKRDTICMDIDFYDPPQCPRILLKGTFGKKEYPAEFDEEDGREKA